MAAEALQTPVIFLIFNRPDATRAVFEEIRRVRPRKLLLVGDGPRENHPGEDERCQQTRAIAQAIDWPCELLTRFAPENLGCRQNVSDGLDWAFRQIEEAIILEDDCLPDPSFFPFCEELLRRYRDEPRVAQICGSNYQRGIERTPFSYYFSRHSHIWGWATWRRAWQRNDPKMTAWPQLRWGRWLRDYIGDAKAAFYWRKLFDDSYQPTRDGLNSWAIPWTFTNWIHGSLSIIPTTNLVTNIGHTSEATHTGAAAGNRTRVEPMRFPLRHPPTLEANREADLFTEESFYYGATVPERLFWALRLPFSVSAVRRARRLVRGWR